MVEQFDALGGGNLSAGIRELVAQHATLVEACRSLLKAWDEDGRPVGIELDAIKGIVGESKDQPA
jgi:hypothetical protein